MDVFTTEIEVEAVVPGIWFELTDEQAEKLRRVCQFNKTIHKRVAERDGEDAGKEIDEFLCELGESLEEEGIERWDPREAD